MKEALGRSCKKGGDSDEDAGSKKEPDFRCVDGGGTDLPTCDDPDQYDWKRLAQTLVDIKTTAIDTDAAPCRVEELVIIPDHEVQYDVIVRAMDVVRDGGGMAEVSGDWKKLLPNQDAGECEEDKESSGVLFPTVVIGGNPIGG